MAAELLLLSLEVHVTSHTKTTRIRDEFYRIWNRKKYFMQTLIYVSFQKTINTTNWNTTTWQITSEIRLPNF